uniref:Uncharacterized protein n=1 Tax=uncultured bacterium contig00013 TaxID=1181504 RepID=A0A806KJH4_9BACT|nr:hypothetical protein [uncultured bacterium contig00013]
MRGPGWGYYDLLPTVLKHKRKFNAYRRAGVPGFLCRSVNDLLTADKCGAKKSGISL